MAEASIADLLSEYEHGTGSTDLPEAGALHYLKRGAIHGLSALADALPNLYNLAKAGIGVSDIPEHLSNITGKPKSTFMPEVGEANPIDKAILESYHLNEPVKPSSDIGGELGASILEGAASSAGQGPIGLAKGSATAMAKEFAKQEAKNAALGAAAGGGSEIGGEATEGSTTGRLIGGVVAGVVAPATFIRKGGVTIGAIRSARQTLEDLKAQGVDKMEPAFFNYVQSQLKAAATGSPKAAENLTEGLRLMAKIPGLKLSVGEMSDSPGLIDMQRKFGLLNPKNLNAEVARGDENAKALEEAYRRVVPVAEAPGSVRSEINQSLSASEKELSGKAQSVAGNLPVADQLATGTELGNIAKIQKDIARSDVSAAYSKAFSVAGKTTVPAKDIAAKAEQILGEPISQIKPANAPQTVTALNNLADGNLTLKDLHDVRVAIGQDMSSATRSMDPTSARRLYNLGQLMPEVDAAIAKFPQAAREAYGAATKMYREDYAPRFKEGTNLRVFKDTSQNEPKIIPDKFVSEYFKTDAQGGITRATQFNKLFNKSPEANDLARTGILDIYRQKVVDPTTGAIDQAAHNTFMRDYGRTLEAYRLSGVDAVGEIKRIGEEAAGVARSMDNMNALAKYMRFDTIDELASDALKNPKTMGNALMRLGEQGRKTFGTVLLDKSFESGTAAGMQKFLDENQKALKMAVPKEQLSAVQDIAKALQMTERAPIRGNIAAGGADMLKNATGTSAATVFSQIRAVTGNRSSVEWAAINMAMPALNKMTQTSFANVMENALHSKQSAVALRNYLMAETPDQANKWATQVLNSMRTSGKFLWSAKGPIVSNFLGPERYPENFARTGSALRPQQEQQQ
jgi:hypothetical protein